jgi:MFS family permease
MVAGIQGETSWSNKEGSVKKGAARRPEDGSRQQAVSRLNVAIALTAAIAGLIYGYDLGSIASAILFLGPHFRLSTFMVSVVSSTVVLGQLFGAFNADRISKTIGRKRTLVLVPLGYAVFAGFQSIAPNKWFLTIARLLLGFVIGVSFITALAYIVESAEVLQRLKDMLERRAA